MLYATKNSVLELSFVSGRTYDEPFQSVDLTVTFSGPNGGQWVVPAFWAGENVWKVRFAPPEAGRYEYISNCSDPANADLHRQQGTVEATDYAGSNPLLRHGRLRMAASRRHLEHADGTPFLWLADTWWMGLCRRLSWPDDFQALAADRVRKGFNVIQIVAGLYPDMPAFDPRGANEAGYPVSKDYRTINPGYFDMADLRLAHLVRVGLVPCVVACWGYFLRWTGVENMKRFWRYLVARYGAYPVVWCLAGEATMPYYLSETKEEDARVQRQGWTELAAFVRAIDPFHNPVTIHPTRFGREQVEDASLLDFEMLQTGHGGRESIPNTVNSVVESLRREPRLPVLVAEVNYEGIFDDSRDNVQRMCFWMSMLSGAAGHTYGANGIWQVNTREQPFGPSPHGRSWGDTPWEDAYQLPGSVQLGHGKHLLERLSWWELAPHPEWVEPGWTTASYFNCYAAGIPGKLRVVYTPRQWDPPLVKGIERNVSYSAFYFNPRNGKEISLGTVEPDADGNWRPPHAPVVHDWLLVLTAR